MGARCKAGASCTTTWRLREHDCARSWFDSSLLDCDVRELANPVHCECIFDGIETRTSPKLSPAARARCLLSRSEARSTRAESALSLVSQLVWTPACRAEERDSISLRGATGLSEGRNTDSKSVKLGSIPSRPATGSDAEGCCFALQAERLGALPSDSTSAGCRRTGRILV